MARALSDDLAHALRANNLVQVYQPQFDSASHCIGAEALLRWNHGNLGAIYPPLIVKLAEENDLLPRLEEQIFKQSVEASEAARKATGKSLKMSVNVCPATLNEPGYLDFVKDTVAHANVDPSTICLEITEQMAFELNTHRGRARRAAWHRNTPGHR